MKSTLRTLVTPMLVLTICAAVVAQDSKPPAKPVAPPSAPPAAQPGSPQAPPAGAVPQQRPAAAAPTPTPAGPPPRIEMSLAEWNFGTVMEGEPIKQTLEIKNSGQGALKITKVHASCGCTVGQPGKYDLAPGEATPFSVSIDSAKRKGHVETTVTVESNDPQTPQLVLKIKGDVKPVFEMKPPTGITFGRLTADQVETRSIEITNVSGLPAELALSNTIENFDVKLETLEPGKKFKLTATTKPPMKVGLVHAQAVFKTGHEKMKELKVAISGTVAPRVSVMPPVLYVPSNASQPQERPVVLNYAGDKPVAIKSLKVVGTDKVTAEVSTAPAPGAAMPADKFKRHNVRVKLPAQTEIPESGVQLEIETDDAEFAKLVVPIKRMPAAASARVLPGAASQPTARGATPPSATLRPTGVQPLTARNAGAEKPAAPAAEPKKP